MREDLLHFIWKTKKVLHQRLYTTDGEALEILQTGEHNYYAGPDFFNAKVNIGGQLWVGNIEMHLKSTDWYVHGHETDLNYDNVILHVVWEDDVQVFRKDGSRIPALQLKDVLPPSFIERYKQLLKNATVKFINCEKELGQIDSYLMESWLESLYVERLMEKTQFVKTLLRQSKNDWEAVLFALLMKGFGTKRNQEAFLQVAGSLDFSTVRKLSKDVFRLESVLLGQAKLLDKQDVANHQLKAYQKEYAFQKTKFHLSNAGVVEPSFFGLRPNNFPTVRLSQLANLYGKTTNFFAGLMAASTVDDVYILFDVAPSEYWKSHYTFGKTSKSSAKKLSKSFVDLLIINTLIPLKFTYFQEQGNAKKLEVLEMAKMLQPEKNTIIESFKQMGSPAANAFETQSRLQLYNRYCSKNKCLQCKVGAALLNKNS